MSGYSFSYKIYKKYFIDIYEYYEDTDFTRAFIYRKNIVGKYLVEIIDFPIHTEKSEILDSARIFINELETLISPVRFKRRKDLKSSLFKSGDEVTDSVSK